MKLIIFLATVMAANAGLLPKLNDWNTLRVSWNPNPLAPWSFNHVPRQISEIKNNEFELRDDLCATSGGKFLGQRYWYKKDPTLNLLFDKNGFIAGIQTSILKSLYTPKLPNFVDDGDYWSNTAYFVDPSIICGAGRTADDFKNQGTGTGLWLQTGPNALTDTYQVPMNEDDIKKTKWGSGKCFWTMGQHYWHDVSKDMDCDLLYPDCLLYNGGKLNAFCFAQAGNHNSSIYDNPHPTSNVIKQFMDPVPDCFFNNPNYHVESTIHIYFSEHPQVTSWC